jgi:hypothetical protein
MWESVDDLFKIYFLGARWALLILALFQADLFSMLAQVGTNPQRYCCWSRIGRPRRWEARSGRAFRAPPYVHLTGSGTFVSRHSGLP